MEINMYATRTAILCSLFLVISWADNKADRSDKELLESSNRAVEGDTDILNTPVSNIKDNLGKVERNIWKVTKTLEVEVDNMRYYIKSLDASVRIVTAHIDILNTSIPEINSKLEILEQGIWEVNKTLEMQVNNMRKLLKNTVSVEEFQDQMKLLTDTRNELAVVKNTLAENRDCVVSLEALNETLQQTAKAVPQNLMQEIAQLKEELQQRKAENSKALEQISHFRENYVSKDELKELGQDRREISNKCSLNVRHKPEDGRFDVRMVMDPPYTEPAASN